MEQDLVSYSRRRDLRLRSFSASEDYRFGYKAIRIASGATSSNTQRDSHDTIGARQNQEGADEETARWKRRVRPNCGGS
jgi:hypothetical protein